MKNDIVVITLALLMCIVFLFLPMPNNKAECDKEICEMGSK